MSTLNINLTYSVLSITHETVAYNTVIQVNKHNCSYNVYLGIIECYGKNALLRLCVENVLNYLGMRENDFSTININDVNL